MSPPGYYVPVMKASQGGKERQEDLGRRKRVLRKERKNTSVRDLIKSLLVSRCKRKRLAPK